MVDAHQNTEAKVGLELFSHDFWPRIEFFIAHHLLSIHIALLSDIIEQSGGEKAARMCQMETQEWQPLDPLVS